MKILYVTQVEDISKTSGVFQKILANIRILNNLGVYTLGLSISSKVYKEKIIENCYKILPYQNSRLKIFSNSINEYRKMSILINYLDENADKFDFILIRYVLGDGSLLNIVKKYGDKLIFEHNTKELDQLKVFGDEKWKSFTSNYRPGYLLTYLESYFFRFIKEKYFGKKIREKVSFGLAVTREIAIYEENRAKGYKCYVISNSIDTKKVKISTPNSQKLKLVMLLSSEYQWHGVSRILEGIKNYKGTVEIVLNIIGIVQDSTKDYIRANKLDDLVKIHQPLFGKQLNEIMSTSNIGIGSLSLFKANLNEASPLKTRDYLARGLPVVVGYHDTDLEKHEEFKPYYIKVPADDSALDFEEIIKFYNRVYQLPDVNQKIRDLAVKYLDTKVKMRELVSIINENI